MIPNRFLKPVRSNPKRFKPLWYSNLDNTIDVFQLLRRTSYQNLISFLIIIFGKVFLKEIVKLQDVLRKFLIIDSNDGLFLVYYLKSILNSKLSFISLQNF